MQSEHPNPVVAEVWRGDMVESLHRGAWCIVHHSGRIIASCGDVQEWIYPRSALKFFQALPLAERGGAARFGLSPAELAVICASHNAEPEHLEAVRSILQKCGMETSQLGCGAHYPMYEPAAHAMIRAGEKPTALHNNCSGKHAGFLALCALLGLPVADYLDPLHPAQKLIKTCLAEMVDFPEADMRTAVDGCSAPVYGFPLYHLALGFARLSGRGPLPPPRAAACRQLAAAVTAHPQLVAGTGRYCTDLMRACGTALLAKTGAEGVFGLCFAEEGIGVAIKIDDGKMGPQYAVAQQIVQAGGLQLHASLHHYLHPEIRNWNGIRTGYIRTVSPVPEHFLSA